MVAHRLSTLEYCDVLLEVANGRLILRDNAVDGKVATH
jgi:hypothetical protein